MSLMDDIIAADSASFADPDITPGSESLTYKKASGATRTITGNITRDPPIELDLGDGVFVPSMTIWIPNNTTNGIDPTEVNAGGDTILVAYPIGATAVYQPIFGTPLSQDAGGCLWAVGSKGR
jgi:hypothetical protein